ncbi:DUF4007 family protein [Diplocloster modestus]|uniref:DUF4007 family protein n=1 Tax=Diplocloster modestus TaxID=2850322 RepID=A0ABS6KEB8_9FIRM|nr:DUF4007 family protein [Diplocloster modestus]MBU9728867.1 DUF4007 family protein [Diplocloster modestus]
MLSNQQQESKRVINRSQLKFHETFQPETGYISKILELASKSYQGSKFEISEITGIPTGNLKGKVEPNIKYAAYMNLITYEVVKGIYMLSLTDMGKEVFEQDRYLQDHLTKWICHYGITQRFSGAIQWAYLVNEAHTGYIQGISQERLLNQAVKFWGVDITFEEAFGVVKRSYLDGIFADLEYFYVDDVSGEFKFNEIQDKEELLFVYAYAILNSWKLCYPNSMEITMIQLMNELSFGKVFGLNDDSVHEVLEDLCNEGILSVNRQLFPATIMRSATVAGILPLLYSRLL